MSIKDNKTIGYILAISAAIIFSSKAVFVKLAYHFDADTLTVLVLRMGFALPIYVLIFLYRNRKDDNISISKRDWLIMITMGIIGYYLSSYFDFLGLQYITANLERLLLFIYPTFTTILAAILLKQTISIRKWIAIVVCYQNNLAQESNDMWLGLTLVVLSALTYSFYLIGSDRLIPKYGAQRFTTYIMIISCIAVLLHFVAQIPPHFFDMKWQVYAIGLTLAIFCTVLPTYMVGEAIKRLGASTTSILSSAGPVSVIFLSMFVLGESVTIYHLIGTAVVIVGISLIK